MPCHPRDPAMPKNFALLSELSEKPPGEFAMAAYETIMGRGPTPHECDQVIASLLRGDSPTWILGRLRYGAEGTRRAAEIPGLRMRYLAQRTWRIPVIGPVLQWLAALVRLPASLRYFRAVRRRDALSDEQARRTIVGNIDDLERRYAEMAAARSDDAAAIATLEGRIRETFLSIDALRQQHASLAASFTGARVQLDDVQAGVRALASSVADLRTRHEDAVKHTESVTASIADLRTAFDDARKREDAIRASLAALQSQVADEAGRVASDRTRIGDVESGIHAVTARIGDVESGVHGVTARIDDVRQQHDGLATSMAQMQPRLESLFPGNLGETLEVSGSPLAALARERRGLPADAAIGSLSPHERYALFESVFYESAAVAEKQRIYLGFLNRALSRQLPFVDLGCGRGEFLRILRDDGIDAMGVDLNPASLSTARDSGLRVFEQDVLAFLESDRGVYSGASLLQVAEHLTAAQLDRLLQLLRPRLAPGGVLIVETPNPLSPFALGVFHTDARHVAPMKVRELDGPYDRRHVATKTTR